VTDDVFEHLWDRFDGQLLQDFTIRGPMLWFGEKYWRFLFKILPVFAKIG
jgi:hypothetical protein